MNDPQNRKTGTAPALPPLRRLRQWAEKAVHPMEAPAAQQTEFAQRIGRLSANHSLAQSWQSLCQPERDTREDAFKAFQAMHGGGCSLGCDRDGVLSALRGHTRREMVELSGHYQRDYGRSLPRDLTRKLSNPDWQRAMNMFQGSPAEATPQELSRSLLEALHARELCDPRRQLSRPQADGELFLNRLQALTPAQRQAVSSHSPAVAEEAGQLLKGDERTRALALLQGDLVSADAARLHQALGTVWSDKREIFSCLGQGREHSQAVDGRFQQLYCKDTHVAVHDGLWGADRQRALSLLEQGGLRPEQAALLAMRGPGCNSPLLLAALRGRSRQQLDASLREKTGHGLQEWISSQWLNQRQRCEISEALQGPATTPGQQAARAFERYRQEREGQPWLGRLVSDRLSPNGLQSTQSAISLRLALGHPARVASEAAQLERMTQAWANTKEVQSEVLATAAAALVAAPLEAGVGAAAAAGGASVATLVTKSQLRGSAYAAHEAVIDVSLQAGSVGLSRLGARLCANETVGQALAEQINGLAETALKPEAQGQEYQASSLASAAKSGLGSLTQLRRR